MAKKELDLLRDKPSSAILKFAVPMLIGALFQQAYSLVDTIVVGNFINSDALAAVGTSGVIMNIVTMAGMGLAVGTSVVTAQYFGAQKLKEVKTAIHTSLIVFVALGLAGGMLGLLIMNPMLQLMNTPAEMMSYALSYLGVIFIGVVFVMLYNLFNQVSIALGDSKTPMLMLLIASAINVVLDLVFTLGLHWGTAGVAAATVLGQGFAALSCWRLIQKRLDQMKTEPPAWFDKQMFKSICAIGLPAVAQNAISASGMLAVQSLLNSFGSVTVAAYTAANKVDGIAMSPMVSLGTAISTYAAQNIGAQQYDRIKTGLRFTVFFAFICCLVTGVLIYGASDAILGLFVSSGASRELFDIGAEYLHVAVFSYFVMAVMFILTGVLKGAGDAKLVFLCSITDLLMRAGFAYALVGILGRYALWLSYPFGWFCSIVIAWPRYLSGKWKKNKIVAEGAAS